MTHYLGYIHRYYLRSYLYTAPVLFLFATLMIVYSDSSNHVLQSYSFGGMWVFLASLWLAYGFTNLEHPTQQQITVLHMGSLQKYLVGKVIYAILLGLFAAACSLLYPILLQRFAVSLTVGKMSIAFIENISMALLGTAIGLYFTQSLIAKKRTAVLVALLTAALAVSSEQMVRSAAASPRYSMAASPCVANCRRRFTMVGFSFVATHLGFSLGFHLHSSSVTRLY